MVNDQQRQNEIPITMATIILFTQKLYLWSKYMLHEIKLTSIKHFFMNGADIFAITANWS